MQVSLSPEVLVHGVELLGVAAVAWIGLKIQNAVAGVRQEQGRVKEELVANQNEMRSDMDEKHAENKQAIAVHTASDEQQFKSIGDSLVRIERKVDVRNGSSH